MGVLQLLTSVNAASGGSFEFPTVANLAWRIRAEDDAGIGDGNPIETATDLSGNGYSVTQPTAGTRPLIQTNDVNGKAVYEFTGSRLFNCGSLAAKTQGSIFAVVKVATQDIGNASWHDIRTAADSNHYNYSDGNIYDGFGRGSRVTVGNPSMDISQWRLVEIVSKSGLWKYLIDNSVLFTTGTNTPSFNSNPRLGDGWIGKMAEAFFVDDEVSGTERTDIITYVNGYYGLSI